MDQWWEFCFTFIYIYIWSQYDLSVLCGVQDSPNLVVERQEEGTPVAPISMNAFELISTSQGLNLSSLFEKQMVCSSLLAKGIVSLSFIWAWYQENKCGMAWGEGKPEF